MKTRIVYLAKLSLKGNRDINTYLDKYVIEKIQ